MQDSHDARNPLLPQFRIFLQILIPVLKVELEVINHEEESFVVPPQLLEPREEGGVRREGTVWKVGVTGGV
jgi:hypothetical protein